MRLSEAQITFTLNVADLIHFANSKGIGLTFGSAHRSQDQQYLYYYGYKIEDNNEKLSFVKTKRRSKTLNSKHAKRLAVDFNFFIDGKLTYDIEDVEVLGEYWESLHKNNRWGGKFKGFIDGCHFEMNI